jgi:hypothetical protein
LLFALLDLVILELVLTDPPCSGIHVVSSFQTFSLQCLFSEANVITLLFSDLLRGHTMLWLSLNPGSSQSCRWAVFALYTRFLRRIDNTICPFHRKESTRTAGLAELWFSSGLEVLYYWIKTHSILLYL